MPTRVRKRDGREVPFDARKIDAAVCKALDVQWTASNNTLKRVADIPPDIEVRSRSGGGPKGDCLIIRPNDPDDRIHILVLGHCPRYELVGAMRAGEAKQEQWWSDYNGRGAAFFLPPTALYPVHLANARARILLYSPAVAGFCVP